MYTQELSSLVNVAVVLKEEASKDSAILECPLRW